MTNKYIILSWAIELITKEYKEKNKFILSTDEEYQIKRAALIDAFERGCLIIEEES